MHLRQLLTSSYTPYTLNRTVIDVSVALCIEVPTKMAKKYILYDFFLTCEGLPLS